MDRSSNQSKQRVQSTKPRVQSIGSLVNQLISRRGYAQVAATNQFQDMIVAVVGREVGESVTVGKLNRGVLKVFANDSVTIQELMFQKRTIIRRIQKELPDAKVNDIRFAVLTK